MPKMISFHEFLPQNKCQQGFTLLEMLLVIALMGMLALSATALVDNLDEQERFETTRTRLQQIKTAMIGDTSRTLNGEPMISGFVADMGRLPNNIEELVELPVTATPWGAINISGVSGVVGQIYGGWRGPYLDVMPSSGPFAVRAFRDGWGTDNGASDPDFGWNVSGVNALSVQSYGSDGPTGTGTGVYEVDYPSAGNLVEANDWQVDLSGVVPAFKITINGSVTATTPGLKLYVYYMKDGVVSTTAEAFASTSFSAVSGVSSQVFEEEHDAISPSVLPMGRLAAIVVCSDGTVFDGACPGAPLTPYYFTLLPRAFTPPINIQWNID